MRYTRTWRNKFLTVDAKTLDEMVVALKAATAELVEIQQTGKVRLEGGADDDYAMLVTEDEDVARKHGLEEEGDFEEIEE
jgi:hypothetical protein